MSTTNVDDKCRLMSTNVDYLPTNVDYPPPPLQAPPSHANPAVQGREGMAWGEEGGLVGGVRGGWERGERGAEAWRGVGGRAGASGAWEG